MTNICVFCGRTKPEAFADANALGLQQEYQAGIYTCCEIGQWANEQALAWFEAVEQDSERADRFRQEDPTWHWRPDQGVLASMAPDRAAPPHTRELQPVFVPRSSRPRVPWYRNPNDHA